MERAELICFAVFGWPVFLTKCKLMWMETCQQKIMWVNVKPYKWYFDYECLFFTISKMVHCLNCVRVCDRKVNGFKPYGIIFFQTIDLLLLPYFEWLNTVWDFIVIDLAWSVWHARDSTKFVTQKIKVLTLYVIQSRLLLLFRFVVRIVFVAK